MKIGDLVRNLNSEYGELGVIINFASSNFKESHPIVAWGNRTALILRDYVEVINESR